MGNLLDIPNEILRDILQIIVDTFYRIGREAYPCFLSRVCLLFRDLMRPLIWGRLRVAFSASPGKPLKFLRSLQENHNLAAMVFEMSLIWSSDDDLVYGTANKILAILPNLRGLTVTVLSKSPLGPFHPHFLDVNPMVNLRRITLEDPNLTTDSMKRYMLLDRIEHINVKSQALDIPTRAQREVSEGESPLLAFEIHENHHMPLEALNEVLEWLSALRMLRCALPGRGDLTEYRNREGLVSFTGLTTPLSPLGIAQALNSVKHSLQTLELIGCQCKWPSHDRSRMDLSMMMVLKSISCPSACFFVMGDIYSARTGISGLLPPSLEELTIHFENQDGLLGGVEQSALDQTQAEKDFAWLLELANAKSRCTPRLSKLDLKDFCSKWYSPTDQIKVELWVAPIVVTNRFEEAGITFKATVQTKSPNGMHEM